MKTYDIAEKVRCNPKTFDVDWYMALKVQAYYKRHGRKVSICRLDEKRHVLWFSDFVSMMERAFTK